MITVHKQDRFLSSFGKHIYQFLNKNIHVMDQVRIILDCILRFSLGTGNTDFAHARYKFVRITSMSLNRYRKDKVYAIRCVIKTICNMLCKDGILYPFFLCKIIGREIHVLHRSKCIKAQVRIYGMTLIEGRIVVMDRMCHISVCTQIICHTLTGFFQQDTFIWNFSCTKVFQIHAGQNFKLCV